MRLGWLIVLLAGALAAVPAIDISGKWVADTFMAAGGADMPVPTTFTFNMQGDKLTGTMESPSGKFEIRDGKVDGDSITFTVLLGSELMSYDGKITEEGIDFIVQMEGRDRTDHFIATRATT